jgi:hypothetical protein
VNPNSHPVAGDAVPSDAAIAQAVREAARLYESTGRDPESCDVSLGIIFTRARELAAKPGEARTPDGYAYRYHAGGSESVLRFNGGGEVNAQRPFEVIPYYLGDPVWRFGKALAPQQQAGDCSHHASTQYCPRCVDQPQHPHSAMCTPPKAAPGAVEAVVAEMREWVRTAERQGDSEYSQAWRTVVVQEFIAKLEAAQEATDGR